MKDEKKGRSEDGSWVYCGHLGEFQQRQCDVFLEEVAFYGEHLDFFLREEKWPGRGLSYRT